MLPNLMNLSDIRSLFENASVLVLTFFLAVSSFAQFDKLNIRSATEWIEKNRGDSRELHISYSVRAKLYSDEKKYAEAESDMLQAVEHAKKSFREGSVELDLLLAEYYGELGNALRLQRKSSEAIKAYTTSLKYDIAEWTNYHWRGHAYLSLDDFVSAEKDFAQAFVQATDDDENIKPSVACDLLMDIAEARYGQKLYAETIEAATEAIKIDPKNSRIYRAYTRQGMAQYKLKNYDLALADLNKAVQLNPTLEAMLTRAFVHIAKEDLESAERDLTRLIQAAPEFANAYAARGMVFADLKKFAESSQDLAKYFSLGGSDKSLYLPLGNSYIEAGEFSAAAAVLNKAIEIDPKSADGFESRAIAYFRLSKLDLALTDLNTSLRIRPYSQKSLRFRALVYLVQDKLPLALADINKAISKEISIPNLEVRASIQCLSGKKLQAKTDETKIIALGGKVTNPCK